MGYKYKIIDNRRQEAPFLILEESIYNSLNVSTLAQVVDISSSNCKLKSLPKGEYFNSNYLLDGVTLAKGDLVLVIFLDNYGTEELNDRTKYIMHDYRNAVIVGKVNKM